MGPSCQYSNPRPSADLSEKRSGLENDRVSIGGRLRGAKAKQRRLLKTYKARKEIINFDIDADHNLERIKILAERAVVGRLEYTSATKLEISEWVNRVWVPFTGLAPRINLLPNRWILFTFTEASHLELIMSRFWEFKKGSIYIKRWHLNFDPGKECQTLRRLWMIIPGLPIEIWTEEVVKGIANSVGRFIRFDKQNLFGMDRRYAKVMVEIDTKDGLPAEVFISWGSRTWNQTLDFYKIPFRCFFCHEIGHVKAVCPSLRESSRDSSEFSSPGNDHQVSEPLFSGKSDKTPPLKFPDLSSEELAFLESSEQKLTSRIKNGEIKMRHDLVTGLPIAKSDFVHAENKVCRSLFPGMNHVLSTEGPLASDEPAK